MRPEDTLHRAIVRHLEARLEPPWMFWHTPNSGIRRSQNPAAFGAYLKAMGQLAGIPDLFVLGPGPVLIGLEVKAPPTVGKRGVSKAKPILNDAQKAVFPRLAGLGVPVIVVRDVDDAIAALSSLGAKFRGRSM